METQAEIQVRVLAFFGNDKNRYEKALIRKNRMAVSWNEVISAVQYFPEYNAMAEGLIRVYLGYLPDSVIVIPHLPFLKALIAQSQQGMISTKAFHTDLRLHLKNIRNDDIWKAGLTEPLSAWDHKRYDDFHAAFKLQARARLSKILGYEPDINHSLKVELALRVVLSSDDLVGAYQDGVSWFDYEAATIAQYLKILQTENKEAADVSPLLGPMKDKK